MNVAILFCGISYAKCGNHYRDFRKTFKSHEEFINKIKLKHSVLVFLCTYPSEKSKEVLSLYKPNDFLFLDMIGSHQRTTFLKGLLLLKDHSENIDFIITLRFDMNIKNINIDDLQFNKFNFLFREKGMWHSHNYICDNFFAFPISNLNILYDSVRMIHEIKNFNYAFMHHLYKPLLCNLGEEKLNFLSSELYKSDNNPMYSLYRVKESIINRLLKKLTWK